MPLANGRSGAWHSSAQQDRAVLALLGAKRGGYFIDLTASDPVKDSNTLALERDYGWGGLCLEPRPYFQQRLTSTRSCTVVGVGVAKVEGTVPLTLERPFGARSPYSALENAVVAGREGEVARVLERLEAADYERESTVRAVTFAHLFRAFAVPRHIDYLSLNADGAEDDLMATFPFETHTVSIVSVQRPSSQLMQLFRAQQYVYLCDCGLAGNMLFVHRNVSAMGAINGTTAIGRVCHEWRRNVRIAFPLRRPHSKTHEHGNR